MLKWLLLLSLFLLQQRLVAQGTDLRKIDSLKSILFAGSTSNGVKLSILSKLVWRLNYVQKDSAYFYLDIYRKLAQKLDKPMALARVASHECTLYIDEGLYHKAAEAAHKRIKIGTDIHNYGQVSGGYSDLGNVYQKNGQLDSALQAYHEAYRFAQANTTIGKNQKTKLTYASPAARSLINISETLKMQGKYILALKHAQLAVEICRVYKLSGYKPSCYNLLCEIYLAAKDYEKAIQSVEKAIKKAKELGNLSRLAISYELLANCQIALNRFSKAEENLHKSILLGEKTNLKNIKGRVTWKLAELYHIQKLDKKALETIQEAEVLLQNNHAQLELIQAKRVKGAIYNNLKNYSAARKACLEAQELNQLAKQQSDEVEICRCLSNAFKGTGEMLKSIYYLERFIILNDSLMNFSITRKLTQLEEQKNANARIFSDSISNIKKLARIELNHEKEVTKQNRLLGVIGMITIVILLVLAFFVVLYFLIKKKEQELRIKNDLIAAQNIKIEASLSQKEILLKEIHHRVKNNLQIILSLLNLQASNIVEPKAIDALKEGQARVKSMALIHQKLYQTDNLAFVEVKDYVKDLVGYLQGIYKQSAAVDIQINIQAIQLDIDTAIPLGLMLNEMLSNCFKYAFENIQEPQIVIAIQELQEGAYELVFQDNGNGMKADFDIKRSTSLGLKLVKRLTQQLFGTFKIENNNGLKYLITFKNTALRKMED